MTLFTGHDTHLHDLDSLIVLLQLLKHPLPRLVEMNKHVNSLRPNWLRNEPCYFDCNDEARGPGVWISLGLTPNQKGSWYSTFTCGPNTLKIAVVNMYTLYSTFCILKVFVSGLEVSSLNIESLSKEKGNHVASLNKTVS